jgi:hypothetical protein
MFARLFNLFWSVENIMNRRLTRMNADLFIGHLRASAGDRIGRNYCSQKILKSVIVSWMHNNAIDINDIGRGYNHKEIQRVGLKTLCSLLSSLVKYSAFYCLCGINLITTENIKKTVTTQIPKNTIMRLRYICTAGPGTQHASNWEVNRRVRRGAQRGDKRLTALAFLRVLCGYFSCQKV